MLMKLMLQKEHLQGHRCSNGAAAEVQASNSEGNIHKVLAHKDTNARITNESKKETVLTLK